MNAIRRRVFYATMLLAVAASALSFAGGDRPEAERLRIRTNDGVDLTVHCYAPDRRGPTLLALLLPEVFENRHAFDLDGTGLAPWLAEAGVEACVLEWRGTGDSSLAPGSPWTWDFDRLVDQDLAAAVNALSGRAAGRPLFLVGHGTGGMAALAFAADVKTNGRLRGIVAIGTPGRVLIGNPIFSALIEAEPKFPPELRIPTKQGTAMAAPFENAAGSVLDVLLTNDKNFDARTRVAYYDRALEPMARPLARQMIRWASTTQWTSADGGRDYLAGLSKMTAPVFFVCGKIDNAADPAESIDAFDALGSKGKTLRVFSEVNGCKFNYGHVGLLLGPRADREVFPHILAWLKNHAAR